MASTAWLGGASQVRRDQGERCPNVGFSASAFWQPRCGLGTPAHPKQSMMRFYWQQHRFYGGIDLHARTISLCVLDAPAHSLRQFRLNSRFERPASGAEEFLRRERELTVSVLVTECRPTPRSVFGAAPRCERRDANFPDAVSVRVALNRSEDVKTD
jgi:hypothetical protein